LRTEIRDQRREVGAVLEVVKLILQKLGKPENLISFVTERLGHDRRYAIDSSFAQRPCAHDKHPFGRTVLLPG